MARPVKQSDETTFVRQVSGEIRRRRLAMFDSVEPAAAAAGVPAPTWYRWEQGAVTLAAIPLCAAALGCTPAALLPASSAAKKKAAKR